MRSLLLLLLAAPGFRADSGPADIVRRSVEKMTADWGAAPRYSYHQREVEEKLGSSDTPKSETVVTYEVTTLDGSEYRKVIARDDEPLPAEEQAQQNAKFRKERDRRQQESPSERASRVTRFTKERAEQQKMLLELVNAFDFNLLGNEMVNGRKTWVLETTPKPGYRPVTREAKVLSGMRGKLWIDEAEYQWVRVEAEVTRPVSFAFGLATVAPGTEFHLEQTPVGDGVWLPIRFVTRVNAQLLWTHRKTLEDETYSDYRSIGRVNETGASAGGGR